ncbi:Fc.00g022320.m01.CDS01 [Cosmosporella sp. VM-42]
MPHDMEEGKRKSGDSYRSIFAPQKLDVAIAGGGISGLITAIALLKHPGVNVQIYERAKEFKEIGASIGLGPNGLRSLEKLGVENALSGDVCTRQKSDWPMIYRHWKTGEIIDHDSHHNVEAKKHFTARYHRAHLHQALLENLPEGIIHLNKKTINVTADPENGATLHFEDGTSAEADICIGADGIHSVRVAYDPKEAVTVLTDKRMFAKLLFRHTLSAGLVGLHFVLSSSLLYSEISNSRKMQHIGLEEFKDLYEEWNPIVQAFIEVCPSVRLFPNFAGAALDTWSFVNRVTLVGDAAHTHGGAFAAGGSLAIDDAYALFLALNHVWPASTTLTGKPNATEIARVFRIYEETRQPHVNKLLGVVHKALSGQRVSIERGKTESDEQLRERLYFTSQRHRDTYTAIDPSKRDFSGKYVFIIGASKGIGQETALSYASAGAAGIGIGARSDLSDLIPRLAEAASVAGKPAPQVVAVTSDVTDQVSVADAAEKISNSFPRLDILVNNAGYLEKRANIRESDPEEWWRTWTVNVKGPYLVTRAFLPQILERGGDKTVVNLSSIAVNLLSPGGSAYQTSKLAVQRFTEFLDADHGPDGILTYGIHPGGVLTDMGKRLPKERQAALTETPKLAADTVVYLTEKRREWLAARYLSATWDMEELLSKKKEIVEK